MSIKKLSRGVIVAFALALVLAVSSFAAYSLNLDGTVAGLDARVDYTAAKYDFANNTYGEFTELTEETVLTAGIWGIKADDAEPEIFFAQSAVSGTMNFWNAEKEAADDTAFNNRVAVDAVVPGKWAVRKDTGFTVATYYAGYPSICIHLAKSSFLTKATTEEGKATWVGATAIEGESNRLAESEYMYGFTNEQVFPLTAFEKYNSLNLAIKVGSVAFKEGYSEKDYGSKVVLYTKTIGSDAITEYALDTVLASGKFSATLSETAPEDVYVIGIGFRPYAGAPDDIFVNNADNTEDNGYYHHWMDKSVYNGVTITPITFDAPTGITGGALNVGGLEDGNFYQYAHVTLNAAGNGYAIGEWQTLTEDTETAGLVVVRLTNEDATLFSEPSDIVYVSGSAAVRQKIGNFKEENGYVICQAGTSDWIPGTFAGNSAGQVGEGGALKPYNSLDQGIGTVENAQTLWLYQHTEAEAEAKLTAQVGNTYPSWTGTPNADTFQKIIDDFYASKAELTADEFAAEKLAHTEKFAAQIEARNNRYAYDNTEIVPVEDASSFAFFVRKRQGCLIFTASSKVVFKVMDLNGKVTDYAWTSPAKSHPNGGDSAYEKYTVDLNELLADAEGYIVGFAIYPFGEIDVSTMATADGQYLAATGSSARFIQNQAEQGWYPDEYIVEIPVYPALTGLAGGYGKIAGLDANKSYEYATLTINAAGTALEQGLWTPYTPDLDLAGLVTVREVTRDGGYTLASAPIYVYGAKDARQALCDVDPSKGKVYAAAGTNTFKIGYWTGKSAATHSSFATYAVSTLGDGWISAGAAKAAKTADANLAADPTNETLKAEALAKRQALSNAVTNNWLYYGYTSDEIIPVNELEKFEFASHTRQGITYSEAYQSEVAVVIAALDGTVSEYKYYTAALKDGSGNIRAVDFTNADAWTPALPSTGYVVGIKVNQWYGKTNPAAWGTSELNSMPTFTFIPTGYVITDPKLVLAPVDADFSNIFVKNGVIKGLDKNVRYGISQATGAGIADTTTILPEGTTSYELPVGLWALRVIGDGITTSNSLPSGVFYKAGNSRGDILHTETVTCTGMKETSPINGRVVERILATTASVKGAVEFNEGLWTATHGYNDNLYVYWEQGSPLNLGSTSNHVKTNAIRTAMNAAAENPEDEALQAALEAKLAEHFEYMASVGFAYQYTLDEIIPMTDFVSHTFKAWCRQTGLKVVSGQFQTKYVLKVMLEDGTIVDRVAYKDVKYGYNEGTIMTVTLDDFTETDGYIVGIVIYPYEKANDVVFGLGSVACDADLDVMFYEDGYKAKAPAKAPTFEIVPAGESVDVVISNPVVGATYAWSLDGATWTNGGVSMRVPAKTGDKIYVKMLAYDVFYESYVSEGTVPAFKAIPELVLGENNVLADTTGAYEIAKYVFGEALTYETLTEKTLTTGVWLVRAKADATAGVSAPQVFYIRGDEAGTMNLVMAASEGFVPGSWSLPKGANVYVSSAAHWETAGKVEFHIDPARTFDSRRKFSLKYLMTEDEILPLSELTNINIAQNAFYHGYVTPGYEGTESAAARTTAKYGQTMARVYVAGASVDYYDVITDTTYSAGFAFNIGDALGDKEGYVTAIELFPLWSIYGADGKTELGDDVVYTAWNYTTNEGFYGAYTFKLVYRNQFIENELPEGESLPTGSYWNAKYADGTNRYAIRNVKIQAEAPVLTIDIKNNITVSDYAATKKLAYSIDGGETWTEFTGSTLVATKANTEYLIKVLASADYLESPASAITTHPLAVVGTTLVLDGQIGVRVYFDIDEDLVNVNRLALYNTKINTDYPEVSGGDNGYREYGSLITPEKGNDWASKFTYDADKGLYYVTVFVPAKDADNITVQTELHYFLKATEEGGEEVQVKYYSVGSDFSVSSYIAQAKALAEAGNEAFADALELINATENYVTYADAYFNGKTAEAYKTDATMNVEAATRTNATLEGVEFYGTSLILEDNVTIRHYFKVNDIDAFVAAGYTCDIDFGTKGDYIYYDITDIAAQNLGEAYALTIKDAEGAVVYEVKYAATNYMASMANDSNANLASLANVMYDYYLAAVDYTK